MKFKSLRNKRSALLAGLALTLFALWFEVDGTEFTKRLFERLDFLAYDLRYQLVRPELDTDQQITIVDIDEDSLAREGRWPWSRERIADLVTELSRAGALVVGFDVIFSEPERNPARVVSRRLETERPRVREWLEGIEATVDGDRILSEGLTRAETVLGFLMHQEPGRREGVLPDPVLQLEEADRDGLMVPVMGGYTGNLAPLQKAALGAGFISTSPDLDGVIRHSPLVLRYGDALYPSLALEMARVLFFAEGVSLETQPFGTRRALDTVKMGHLDLQTDAQGRALVPFQGGRFSYPYVSAADVLRGTLSEADRNHLRDALVLVGSSAQGLDDLVTTPIGTGMPGVEVHATLLEGIIAERLPHSPDWERGMQLLLLGIVGIVLSLVLPFLAPFGLILVVLTALTAVFGGYIGLWVHSQLDVSIALPVLLIIALFGVNLTFSLVRENQSRRVLKSMFDQYVPPDHIDAMLESPEAYGFEGETRELTVLFSDIRGFTSLSERLDATDLKLLLNRFFTPVTQVIFHHEGTIDKYVGDMVMAFWGAPLHDPAHREHALDAALAMLREVERLKVAFRQQGLPEIDIGIGLNSGLMNVGDMGSSYRRAYTVLGDAVNLGARLESITKYYGARLLVGEQTRAPVEGFVFQLVDRIQVKGKEEAIRVYEPLGREAEVSPELLRQVEQHHLALDYYLNRDWDRAETLWSSLVEMNPDCQLYRLYRERVQWLREEDPGPEWDGTFRHTSK